MKIVVLDDNWPQTALLIHELHRQKVDVLYVAPTTISRRGLGRYCRHRRSPPMTRLDYAGFLIDLLAAEPHDFVLPVCDPLQRLAWRLPEPFGSRVFPTTTAEQRHLLDDRRALYALATMLGVPVPRMLPVPALDTAASVGRDLGWPLVFRGTQGCGGEQVRIVRNHRQMIEAYAALSERSPEPPFAQEFVSGECYLIGALLDHGRALQTFAQVAVEVFPASTGPSIRVRSINDSKMVGYATRLFAALGWHGLACAEFVRATNGELRFLEINPRPWGSIQAAEACGAPMLRPFVQLLKGDAVDPPRPYVVGREVALFPAYLGGCIRSNRFPRIQDIGRYLRMGRAMPWAHPGLLFHATQQLFWQWRFLKQRKSLAVASARPNSQAPRT